MFLLFFILISFLTIRSNYFSACVCVRVWKLGFESVLFSFSSLGCIFFDHYLYFAFDLHIIFIINAKTM